MNNRFVLVLIACIVAFVGIFWFTKKDANAPTAGSTNQSVKPTEHKTGKGTAGVTLTEYGDFQCPACYQYEPIVEQVRQKFDDQITFQFRNFPLIQIHQNAMAAARAAEAADSQGKYWEMHDLLYKNQPTWESSTSAVSLFESYAQSLGLDVNKFKQDAASSHTNDIINADLKAGQDLQINGTPTFFVNGQKIDNPRSADDFSKVIQDAITAKASSH